MLGIFNQVYLSSKRETFAQCWPNSVSQSETLVVSTYQQQVRHKQKYRDQNEKGVFTLLC